jgi:V/A-type H+-transporting ATPase subunit A
MRGWYDDNLEPGWVSKVQDLQALLERGEQIDQMMQVTGEEGVTIDDFITQQQALFVDMVYLQQDAFDDVDASVPVDRQKLVFKRVYQVATASLAMDDKAEARRSFTELMGLFKNFHYEPEGTPAYVSLLGQIDSKISDMLG